MRKENPEKDLWCIPRSRAIAKNEDESLLVNLKDCSKKVEPLLQAASTTEYEILSVFLFE